MKHLDGIRIVHITAVRRLSAGQRNQLRYEYAASSRIPGVSWTTIALHTEEAVEPFERRIPRTLQPLFLRNLYAWMFVRKIACQYDFVMLRHMAFDPFAIIFSPLIKNRISVHHSKEAEELLLVREGFRGRMASAFECITGRFSVRHTTGILGVTDEIARYERDLHAPNKPCSVYPNGVYPELIPLADDLRKPGEIHAVLFSGKFPRWIGLDRLVDAADRYCPESSGETLNIHLIGELTAVQRDLVRATPRRRSIFTTHGSLPLEQYRETIMPCDVGIGSLALDRNGLVQGSTLKVRELLAMGIPVYSGHSDTSIPINHPHYRQTDKLDISELINFAKIQKQFTRQEVRNHSLSYISKQAAMENTVKWMKSLMRKRSEKG